MIFLLGRTLRYAIRHYFKCKKSISSWLKNHNLLINTENNINDKTSYPPCLLEAAFLAESMSLSATSNLLSIFKDPYVNSFPRAGVRSNQQTVGSSGSWIEKAAIASAV